MIKDKSEETDTDEKHEKAQRKAWAQIKSLTREEIATIYRATTLRAAKFMGSYRYPLQELQQAAAYACSAMEYVGTTESWQDAGQFKSLALRKVVWLIRDAARRDIHERDELTRLRLIECGVMERTWPSDPYGDDGEHLEAWVTDSTEDISQQAVELSDPQLQGTDMGPTGHFETCDVADEPLEEPELQQAHEANIRKAYLELSTLQANNPDVGTFLKCCQENPDLLYVDKGHRWRFKSKVVAEKLGWDVQRVYNVRHNIRDSSIAKRLSQAWHMYQCGDVVTVSEALALLQDETSNGR